MTGIVLCTSPPPEIHKDDEEDGDGAGVERY
jgi:hypothetical protein